MKNLSLILIVAAMFLGIPSARAEFAAWKTIDAKDYFTLRVPTDMQVEPIHGVDSYVGQYQNDELRLFFDYGWFSNSLSDEPYNQYKAKTLKIDRKKAKMVVTPQVVAVHFPKVNGAHGRTIKLTVSVQYKTPAGLEAAKKIVKSIRFGKKNQLSRRDID